MKLFGYLAAYALAAKDAKWDEVTKRHGKHGRLNAHQGGQDRLLLHYPICMTNRDSPLCDKTCIKKFDNLSGQIKVKDYNSFRSCLWEINVPAGNTLTFQFVDEFNLEYHTRCGFDRVHIFSGTIDGETRRQGRFCGPKPGTKKPYDGSRRNNNIKGVMPFWDEPYDIQSNNAIVGFDSDQTLSGGGFTLIWNSYKTSNYDFTNVYETHSFLTKQAEYLFGSVNFEDNKKKKKYTKMLQGKIIGASLRALSNNPGSKGEKQRRCAKSEALSVNPSLVNLCSELEQKVNLMEADFSDAMSGLIALIDEFLGECTMAGEKWPLKVRKFSQSVTRDRIL